MIKKLCLLLLSAILASVMLSVTAFAASGVPDSFQAVVDKANASIDAEIAKAQQQADSALDTLNKKIDITNQLAAQRNISKMEADGRIMNYKADFENQITAIASRLVSKTDAIAVSVMQEAQRYGICVTITYKPVNLAGRIVMVDPLRIVGN